MSGASAFAEHRHQDKQTTDPVSSEAGFLCAQEERQ